MKSKLIFRNVMDIKPFATVLVDVTDSWDGEPVRTKLIELLCKDPAWKDFGSDGDIIEVEHQYESEDEV